MGGVLVPLFLSLVGMALLVYGKKEARGPHVVVGLVLLVFPHFVGALLQVLVAVAMLTGLAVMSRFGY